MDKNKIKIKVAFSVPLYSDYLLFDLSFSRLMQFYRKFTFQAANSVLRAKKIDKKGAFL